MVEYTGSECAGVPNCFSVAGPETIVGASGGAQLAVTCPESHPNSWHWDTQQHEHLSVKLLGRTRHTLSFGLINRSTVGDGMAAILIGCSDQPFSAVESGTQTSRSGLPSQYQIPPWYWPYPKGDVQ
jgi:hypothetical protein